MTDKELRLEQRFYNIKPGLILYIMVRPNNNGNTK